MNENDLERRLRTWHGARVDSDERAPMGLRNGLAAIPQETSAPPRLFDRPRFVLLAAALLAALLIGGAAAIGSGILRFPSLVIVTPSPNETPDETPIETKRPAGWSDTGAMQAARQWHTATLLVDGRVLVAGGAGSAAQDDLHSSAEIYDPTTGTWVAAGNMSTTRYRHSAVRLADGRVLIAGGESWGPTLSGSDGPVGLNSAEIYDPVAGTWSPTGSMHSATTLASVVLLNDGRVLMVGFGHAELYDPVSGAWSVTGRMTIPRDQANVVLLADGRVLAAGGFDDSTNNHDLWASDVAEIWDPATGNWSLTGRMSVGRYRAAATRLQDGRVLVSGGENPYSDPQVYLASAEIYDPAAGIWSASGSIARPRAIHTSVLLESGEVIIAGGMDLSVDGPGEAIFGGLILGSAELYDPTAGTWRVSASMTTPRIGQTATLLDDGSVLMVGGQLSADEPTLATAELYQH